MDFFAAASIRAAVASDFAEYVDIERAQPRQRHRRPDGLTDALRLLFGRQYRETRRSEGQWPMMIPPS